MKLKTSSEECTNPWFSFLAIFLISGLTLLGIFAVRPGNLSFWHFVFAENVERSAENILIASTGKDLNFPVAGQLEMCKYLIIVNPSTGKYRSIPCTANFRESNIAGFFGDNNITAVITGTMNIDTYRLLESSRVDIYTGVAGTGAQVVELYQADRLVEFSESGGSRQEKRISPERGNLNSNKKILF